MSAPIRARALTAPIASNQLAMEFARPLTNDMASLTRDHHADPPSIVAQNRELSGLSAPPRARTATCTEEHACTHACVPDSSDSEHRACSEGTVVTSSRPGRRSTMNRLTEAARDTTRVAKRKLSKVIPWRRKDSTTKEDDNASPPNKASRRRLGGGIQAHGSRESLLDDGQESLTADDGSSESSVDLPTPDMLDHVLQLPPHEGSPASLSLKRSIANALSEGAIPQPSMQDTVEFYNQRAHRSADQLPHTHLMHNPERWAKAVAELEEYSRDPRLVERRFDQLYKAMW